MTIDNANTQKIGTCDRCTLQIYRTNSSTNNSDNNYDNDNDNYAN